MAFIRAYRKSDFLYCLPDWEGNDVALSHNREPLHGVLPRGWRRWAAVHPPNPRALRQQASSTTSPTFVQEASATTALGWSSVFFATGGAGNSAHLRAPRVVDVDVHPLRPWFL